MYTQEIIYKKKKKVVRDQEDIYKCSYFLKLVKNSLFLNTVAFI